MPEKSFNRAARWTGLGLAIVVTILIAVVTNREGYKKREFREVPGYAKWSEEVVGIAKRIPVQDGGRVKPLETRAGFLMLKLHGARKMKIKSGEEKISIGPTEWLLDILFRPELAMKMPTFRVDDSDLLKNVGMDVKSRRDRYSYVDLEPYLQEIGKKAGDIQKQVQEETQKNPDYKFPRNQTDPRALARKIMEYQGMLATHDFARDGLTLDEGAEVANGEEMRKVSYWVKLMPVLGEMLRQEGLAEEGQIPPHVQKLLNEMSFLLGRGEGGIEWLPPYEAEVVLTPGGQAKIHSGDTVKTFEIECKSRRGGGARGQFEPGTSQGRRGCQLPGR